ncbi:MULTISPECIES: hypothetical protein [Streptomyces]|uniref:hypothetical protein n=1 Tax=Streptomyces TaxID=1883 RepID=UPI00340CB1C3
MPAAPPTEKVDMPAPPQWSNLNDMPRDRGLRAFIGLNALLVVMIPTITFVWIISVSDLPLPWRLAAAAVCSAALLSGPVWMVTRRNTPPGWAMTAWMVFGVVVGLGAAAATASGIMANAPSREEGTPGLVTAAVLFAGFGFFMPFAASIAIDGLRRRSAAISAADTEARVARIVADAETARAEARQTAEGHSREIEDELAALGEDHAAQLLRIREAAEAAHDQRLQEIEEAYRQRLNVELARATACAECARRDQLFAGRGSDAAYVYVIVHEQYAAVKVGISSRASRASRLRAHMDHSWTVVGIVDRLNYRQANAVEKAALAWMRTLSDAVLVADQIPQGGHTETAAADLVPPEKLWCQVKGLAIQHGGVPLRLDS